ncbi:MAG TPA: stage II sporulation protein P [Firmicutes bacterium]|nr:stage II sporulation protein P [Candidatus Fermentithermobacillaceae bacterium]
MKRNARAPWGLLIILFVLGLLGSRYYLALVRTQAGTASDSPTGSWEKGDGYFTVKDPDGNILFHTGHYLFEGDEYIDENDVRWVIQRVEGDTATAASQGKMEALPSTGIAAASTTTGKIAIYHTHSDESYIPDDGSDAIPGAGGVIKVGSSMADALEKTGLIPRHDKTPHDPHDAAAYDRSRRTAQRLLRSDPPLAIFDVHRDAGPPEPYLTEQRGEVVARAMIVVGRQNPKIRANLEFARRLKDAVNSKYPGLIKGIFMGKADFNQDLFERSLLLEVGTEKTPRAAAERGVQLIAGVLPQVVSAVGPAAGRESGGAGRTIAWLIGVVVAGVFIYLWVSTGSWEEMKAKILGWFGTGGVKMRGGRGGEGEGS